jgi:hypothetical protein
LSAVRAWQVVRSADGHRLFSGQIDYLEYLKACLQFRIRVPGVLTAPVPNLHDAPCGRTCRREATDSFGRPATATPEVLCERPLDHFFGETRSCSWGAGGQLITLVDPPHRGHRLGTIVKIANLRYAMAGEPALRVVDTWNAAVNDHMISINEAIGFRAMDALVDWQRTI